MLMKNKTPYLTLKNKGWPHTVEIQDTSRELNDLNRFGDHVKLILGILTPQSQV